MSFGVAWYFVFPLWEKRQYINHYKAFIKETYREKIGILSTVEFTNNYIFAKDSTNESKTSTTEIQEICEIPTTILIRLKSGQSFILPKHQIEILDSLKAFLKEIAAGIKVNYTNDEKWEWN